MLLNGSRFAAFGLAAGHSVLVAVAILYTLPPLPPGNYLLTSISSQYRRASDRHFVPTRRVHYGLLLYGVACSVLVLLQVL